MSTQLRYTSNYSTSDATFPTPIEAARAIKRYPGMGYGSDQPIVYPTDCKGTVVEDDVWAVFWHKPWHEDKAGESVDVTRRSERAQ